MENSKTRKPRGTPITDEIKAAVQKWLHRDIGIQEFMNLTGTSQSSCYSVIARACRENYKN